MPRTARPAAVQEGTAAMAARMARAAALVVKVAKAVQKVT